MVLGWTVIAKQLKQYQQMFQILLPQLLMLHLPWLQSKEKSKSLDEKKSILRNKLKLRREEHSNHIRKLFITPDLTPSEQKESKALRLQLIQMNQGTKKYRIKNGQIVQRGPQ